MFNIRINWRSSRGVGTLAPRTQPVVPLSSFRHFVFSGIIYGCHSLTGDSYSAVHVRLCHGTVLSSRRAGFNSRPVRMRFLMDKVSLGHGFLLVFPFSPVSIITPMLHTHLDPYAAVTRSTNVRSLGTFRKHSYFGNRGALGIKVLKRCFYARLLAPPCPSVHTYQRDSH